MNVTRREFLQVMAAACSTGLWTPNRSDAATGMAKSTEPINRKTPSELYDVPAFGNVSLMHFTDCHAQLQPIYYREPHTHIGIGQHMQDTIPHIVGKYFLDRFNIPYRSERAYALTFLDFPELAAQYGRMGGFAHLSTLVKRIRTSRPGSLLLDGGDTWQGSGTAMWTQGQDMIDAAIKLGVDVMTGHWEFTYGIDRVNEVISNDFAGHIEFVAQNVVDNEFEDPVFKAFTIREINGVPIAIVGQAFPYTRVAHPKHFTAGWQFGLQETRLQDNVNAAKKAGAQAVVLLSHNGMDVDIKIASKISGIDFILGGHTHDAIPTGVTVSNLSGKTVVFNSGTNGKFLSLLDMDIRNGKLHDYQFKLLPVFSNLLEPDPEMAQYITEVRAPYLDKLNEKLAINHSMLFRRGTFNGTFDQLIVEALMKTQDTEIALSPGFRWGTTLLPGQAITMEDVLAQTAITYPIVVRSEMTGEYIKERLEDIADNRFNPNPYYQQGGDMVRVGGLSYSISPNNKAGSRIDDIRLQNKAINASKKYSVAGWASMENLKEGKPIWDVVAEYLRDIKTIEISAVNTPKLKGVASNKGLQIDTYLG